VLVLSRKVNESIDIGNNIKITIVRIQGGGVRIGIEAPSEITITRSELKPQAQEEPKTHVSGEVPTS
jgi:carbon storage regulator